MAKQTASTSRRRFAEEVLELGEDLLDGVQVGRIFWKEEELGAGGADELAHGFAFVTAEIVDNNDVIGAKRRHEDIRDIDPEALTVDRTFNKPWRVDAIVAQRRNEGHSLPATMWDLGVKPAAAQCPPPERGHVGPGPGLVDEDQTLRRDAILISCPLRPPPCDVGTVAFASHHAFF